MGKYVKGIIVTLLVILTIAGTVIMAKYILDLPETSSADSDLSIKTPYAVLHYPSNWKGHVRTEQVRESPYKLVFYSVFDEMPDQRIFEISIGHQVDEPIGTIQTADGDIVQVAVRVCTIVPHMDISDEGMDKIHAMQEDLNYLLERLDIQPLEETEPTDEYTVPTEPTVMPVVRDPITVHTPYVSLVYSGEWAQYLQTEHEDADVYTVSFYACIDELPRTLLFSVAFGGEYPNIQGYLKTQEGETIGVCFAFAEIQLDDRWTQEQKNIIWAMQDQANELLRQMNLQEPEDETEPGIQVTEPEETEPEILGDILVETPYCVLSYPEKWRSNIRAEHEKGDVYAVLFYGKVADHDECHLFTVRFGDDEGVMLGMIAGHNNEIVPVSIVFIDNELGADWTEEERMEIYSMQDDINFLIENLPILPIQDSQGVQ
jgi:hypothetical protein